MTAVTLPAGPSTPALIQGMAFAASGTRSWHRLHRRNGSAFTASLPRFGRVVVLSDPAEVKTLFTAGPELVDNIDVNLGQFLGPGSMFSLNGEHHRRHRKLLTRRSTASDSRCTRP